MSGRLVPVVIRMPAELHEAVKEVAEYEDRSVAATMRWALKVYVTQRQCDDLAEGVAPKVLPEPLGCEGKPEEGGAGGPVSR